MKSPPEKGTFLTLAMVSSAMRRAVVPGRVEKQAVIETPTRALRTRAPEVLRAGLLRVLVEGEDEWLKDWRDLLVGLAPYHDCARRLGLDPVVLFDAIAEEGPRSLREIVTGFGRRTDVTPQAFGYVVTETSDGPRYDWAPSSF